MPPSQHGSTGAHGADRLANDLNILRLQHQPWMACRMTTANGLSAQVLEALVLPKRQNYELSSTSSDRTLFVKF